MKSLFDKMDENSRILADKCPLTSGQLVKLNSVMINTSNNMPYSAWPYVEINGKSMYRVFSPADFKTYVEYDAYMSSEVLIPVSAVCMFVKRIFNEHDHCYIDVILFDSKLLTVRTGIMVPCE